MIIYDVQQDTPEWLALRLGLPTASEFHKIVGNSTAELSRSRDKKSLSEVARKYAHRLVAETLLGRPVEKPPGSPWAMARGKALQETAARQYAFAHDIELQPTGFVTTDCGRLGCSPDALIIGTLGGLEIKCALDEGHMGHFLDGPGDDFKPQVQGCLAICELDWWDLHAYHPELPPLTIRTYRDEAYIKRLQASLAEFLAIRDQMLEQARGTGFFEHRAAEPPAAPYPFCRDPARCAPRGYCQADPACNN